MDLCAAGLPANDGRMYCPSHANATSCYYLNTSTNTHISNKSACIKMGGHLIAYNTAFEQLDVETHFGLPGTDYVWIGLEPSGNLWYWPDGRARGTACLQGSAYDGWMDGAWLHPIK